MTEREVVLQVEHLSLWIRNEKKEIPILHDLSFTVREGERWAIAGESGAGKSMTMSAVTGLLPAGSTRMEGSIRYRTPEGALSDLLEVPYKKRQDFLARQVAVIFQDSINALNPNETIRKQWGQTVRRSRPDLSGESLDGYLCTRMEVFGIRGGKDTLLQYPDQLSGGMRQRIAIAMALESQAPVLVADEPTTSLDAITQRRAVDFIRSLVDGSGQTLLYISHNLGILQYMCDHAMVMYNGRIVEQGEIAEVFGNPKADYTRQLVEQTRKIMGAAADGNRERA